MRNNLPLLGTLCAITVALGCVPPPDDATPPEGTNDAGTTLPPPGTTPPPPPPPPAPPSAYTLPPAQTALPTYELIIPQAAMDEFAADVMTPEQPATFVHEGRRYDVRVRLRGGSSRHYPKRSWRVEFPEGTEFDGRRKLNLVGEQQDRTLMVEKLGFDLLLAMGQPAPRTKWVRLIINGRFEGPFLDIQRVDRKFLKNHQLDEDANIYRCGSQDCELKLFRAPYQGEWQKQTNETEPSDDLRTFLALVNRSPEPDFASRLEQALDLDGYLESMAMDALISNDIVMDSGSYLVHDRVRARWSYVPWDLNNSAARWWPTYGLSMKPIVNRPVPVFALQDARTRFFYDQRNLGRDDYLPAFSSLSTRVFNDPALRERLAKKLERALTEVFNEKTLHPWIEQHHALLRPHVERDPYVNLDCDGRADPDGLAKFLASKDYMKSYVTGRAAFLRAELARWRSRKAGLVIGAFDPAAQWVELENRGSAPVPLEGKVLTTDLRRPFTANLPARTLAPNERLRFHAAELGLTFGGEGELGLFDGTGVAGIIDPLFYGRPPAGKHYQRASDGSWIFQ